MVNEQNLAGATAEGVSGDWQSLYFTPVLYHWYVISTGAECGPSFSAWGVLTLSSKL